MKILFRVDASNEIGMGHLSRCLSIADHFKEFGLKAVFYTKTDNDRILDLIVGKGYKVYKLAAYYDLKIEIKKLKKKINSEKFEVVITDGYQFKSDYLYELKKICKTLVSIDDTAQTFFPSDIVLNQNIGASKKMYDKKIGKNTKLLLGASYTLLDPWFQNYRKKAKVFSKTRTILVTFGGSDLYNQTYKVLEALKSMKHEIKVLVVLGMTNRHKDEIKSYIKDYNKPIQVVESSNNMAELIHLSDIAVSGAGSTCWELCCLGTPLVLIAVAENQRMIAGGLAKHGAAINLGWHEDVSKANIRNAVEDLILDNNKLAGMSLKGRMLVDGLGADRVIKYILKNISYKKSAR